MGLDLMGMYKISDVLQMPLQYDGKAISGSRNCKWESQIGLTFPMQLSARAVFFSEQFGVVAHVLGNLYIMVSYNPERHGLSAYLIDNDKMADPIEDMVSKGMNLRDVVEYLRPAIVQGFYNTSGAWKPLTLPK